MHWETTLKILLSLSSHENAMLTQLTLSLTKECWHHSDCYLSNIPFVWNWSGWLQSFFLNHSACSVFFSQFQFRMIEFYVQILSGWCPPGQPINITDYTELNIYYLRTKMRINLIQSSCLNILHSCVHFHRDILPKRHEWMRFSTCILSSVAYSQTFQRRLTKCHTLFLIY